MTGVDMRPPGRMADHALLAEHAKLLAEAVARA